MSRMRKNNPKDKEWTHFVAREIEKLPEVSPRSNFTDCVMKSIAACPLKAQLQKLRHRHSGWNNEFIHSVVAAAATFVFVASGLMKSILNVSVFQLGYEVQNKVGVALIYGSRMVQEVSETFSQLLS